MSSRSQSVRCAIIDEEKSDEILGLISLMDINYINRSAELHIMIGNSENRGRGVGTFAVKAIIAHAFNNMNLRRIELGVLENNAAAIHVYEKVGFIREWLRRQSNYKNGMNIPVRQSHQSGLNGATIPVRESQQKCYAAKGSLHE